MEERIYLDRPDVYILADCHARDGGRALYVVCEDPAGAEYASQLATGLRIPLRHRNGLPPPARRAGPVTA